MTVRTTTQQKIEATTGAAVLAAGLQDPTAILTPKELLSLRGGFDAQDLLDAAQKAFPYPKQGELVNWIDGTIFNDQVKHGDPRERRPGAVPRSSLTPFERETTILAIVTAQRDPFPVAVHFYWALMEAVQEKVAKPVEKLADVLMTVGAYSGLSSILFSNKVMTEILNLLKNAAAAGGAAVQTQAIVGGLVKTFA